MNALAHQTISKVPAATLGFRAIKVLASTLGETGDDAVTMTLGLGSWPVWTSLSRMADLL